MSKKESSPKLFACSQSMVLAKKIAEEYGVPLGNVKTTKFSDGEFQPAFEESVRGRRVFIIGSTFPTADNLMEMLLMLDAAKELLQDILLLLCLILGGLVKTEKTSQELL